MLTEQFSTRSLRRHRFIRYLPYLSFFILLETTLLLVLSPRPTANDILIESVESLIGITCDLFVTETFGQASFNQFTYASESILQGKVKHLFYRMK